MLTVLPLIRILCSRWYLILTCQQETRCICSARGLNQLQPLPSALAPAPAHPRLQSPELRGAAHRPPPQHTPAPLSPLPSSRTLCLQEAPQPPVTARAVRGGEKGLPPVSEPEPRPPRTVVCSCTASGCWCQEWAGAEFSLRSALWIKFFSR